MTKLTNDADEARCGGSELNAGLGPWISVDDCLPNIETDVLVRGLRFNSLYHAVAGIFDGVWKSQETEKELLFEPSEWMPIP